MSYTLKLEQFEGPLELLLKLIEDEELDITTISLAKVTDQYLAFVEREDELPRDEVADFLVVAAKLIYIKSKHLLPSLELEEEDDDDLEQQLKMYREYHEASKGILKMLGKKKFAYVRTVPLKYERERGFAPPPNVTVAVLATHFRSVLGRLEAIIALPKIVLKTTVSIREKIVSLRDAISRGVMQFRTLYDSSNKQDVIVSFLALLELVKMRHAVADQSKLFADITITRHGHE